jgi:hypothetical protein
MGGWGSGREEYATTPVVEECRHLDVDRIKKFTKHPGRKGPVWWGDREDPEAWITVTADGERDVGEETRTARLRLSYTLTDGRTDESEDVEYPVPLEYTECNFGGYRPWFRCPGKVDGEACRRRVRKLYLPLYASGARYYLCRECYGLGYRSSRTSGDPVERAEQRYRKAFKKADTENRRPHPNNLPAFPERPKGMHHDTFEDLLADVREASREHERAFMDRARELAGVADGVDLPPPSEWD